MIPKMAGSIVYPNLCALPVYPNTPKCISRPANEAFKNETLFQMGAETVTITSKTHAAKQKNKPGSAGEAMNAGQKILWDRSILACASLI